MVQHSGRQPLSFFQRQRGTAILVALFLTVLVAGMATAMMLQGQRDIRRTTLLLQHIQARLYAEGAVSWARDMLVQNLQKTRHGTVVDHLPLSLPPSVIAGENVRITAVLTDAQGRINLNNLQEGIFQQMFVTLLRNLAPDMTPEQHQLIALGIADWITEGVHDSPYDQYYAGLQPAFHAPHHPMTSASELRMIRGMTAGLYSRLLPFVTALPEKTSLNLNTASVPVLMALDPAITAAMAGHIVQARKEIPLTDNRSLQRFPFLKNSALLQGQGEGTPGIIFVSQYFLLETDVTLGDHTETFYTMLYRTTKDGKIVTGILWQSTGTL